MTPAVIVAPEDYYNIVQSTRGLNADYTSNNGGIDTGVVQKIAGTPIVVTNHLPAQVDGKDVEGYFFTPGVMGVVKAMDIQSESNYDFRRLGYQLTSYYAMGMAPLNPTGMEVINDDS